MQTFKTLTLTNLVDKVHYIDQVWEILVRAYDDVDGGLLFLDKADLIGTTAMWRIAVKKGTVIAVSIFKKKFGMKLVALGADKRCYGDLSTKALSVLIQSSLTYAWMEVSEAAENFIMKRCGGEKFLLHHSLVVQLMKKQIQPSLDGYHYERVISGIRKEKIALGTPQWSGEVV